MKTRRLGVDSSPKGEALLNQKRRGGEGKANWQMAGREMVRGFQKWGLEAEAQSYTPRGNCHLICLPRSLGEIEGIWFMALDKAKGSGISVRRRLSDTGGDLTHGHQR